MDDYFIVILQFAVIPDDLELTEECKLNNVKGKAFRNRLQVLICATRPWGRSDPTGNDKFQNISVCRNLPYVKKLKETTRSIES